MGQAVVEGGTLSPSHSHYSMEVDYCRLDSVCGLYLTRGLVSWVAFIMDCPIAEEVTVHWLSGHHLFPVVIYCL